MSKIFKITPVGNLGNQMLQLMLARAIAQQVPGLDIVGYDLDEWQLRAPVPADFSVDPLVLKGQHVEFDMIVSLLKRNMLNEIDLRGLGFRMEHYLPRETYQELYAARLDAKSVSDDALLINVRGAEILGNVHEDYGPLPLAFYRGLIESTRLRPVFMGQIADDHYSATLRKWFPDAEIIPSQGIMSDFSMIRNAKNIVVSVSTFSWLAAWLSDAAVVHLPLYGIFNPVQRPDINLIPLLDSRYRFYDFPVRSWNGSPPQLQALTDDRLVFPMLHSSEVEARLTAARQKLRWRLAKYRATLAWRVFLKRTFGVGGGVIMRMT